VRCEETGREEAGAANAATRTGADGHDPGAGNGGTAAGVRSNGREGVACSYAEPQAEMKPNYQIERGGDGRIPAGVDTDLGRTGGQTRQSPISRRN